MMEETIQTLNSFFYPRIAGLLPRSAGSQDKIQDYVSLNNLRKKTDVPEDSYFIGDDGMLVYSQSRGKMVPIPRIG